MIISCQISTSGNDEARPPTFVIGNSFENVKVKFSENDGEGNSKENLETEFNVEKDKK